MSVPQRTTGAPKASQDDALAVVHRELTGIYASIAESPSDDPEVVPWTLREIRGVLDYIQAVRQARQDEAHG